VAHPASCPMATRALSLGREADHSPPSSVEVKECMEVYFHTHNKSSWSGVYFSTGTTLPLPYHRLQFVLPQLVKKSTIFN